MPNRHSRKHLRRKRDFLKHFRLRCRHIWGPLSRKMSTGRSVYYSMERIKWTGRIGNPLKISSRTIVFVRRLHPISQDVLHWNIYFVGIDSNRALWYLPLPLVYCMACSWSLWCFDTISVYSCIKLNLLYAFIFLKDALERTIQWVFELPVFQTAVTIGPLCMI